MQTIDPGLMTAVAAMVVAMLMVHAGLAKRRLEWRPRTVKRQRRWRP